MEVYERDLASKRQQEIPRIAEQVGASVVRLWSKSDELFCGIGGKPPIQWEFRILPREERDFDAPESGIRYMVNLGNALFEPSEKKAEERAAYSKEFEHQAERAAEKFIGYPDCRKLLLVQFFGDSFGGVGDREIRKMIRSASLPEVTDEVWVARQGWVGLDESETRWQRVRGK